MGVTFNESGKRVKIHSVNGAISVGYNVGTYIFVY